MKDQIQVAIQKALTPIKKDIESLKAQFAMLAPLAAMAQAMEMPPSVLEAQEIAKTIPKLVLTGLKVVGIKFDPNSSAPWFAMVRKDGTISVKKTVVDFRIRLRNETGDVFHELNVPFNGLIAALKSLI